MATFLYQFLRIWLGSGLFVLILVVGTVPTAGQDSDAGPSLAQLPPPPASQIWDDGRVFNPEEALELSQYLKGISDKHDIQVYVAIYSFVSNETVEGRAHRLRKAWANTDTGVIVVYERGSAALSIVATDDIDGMMTRYDVNRILEKAGKNAQVEKTANRQVYVAVTTLGDTLVESIERRREANAIVAKKRTLLITATFAAIVLLALVGWLLARLIRKSDRKKSEFYYFPPVRVGMRYGAPFTGGANAEVRFSKELRG